LVLIPLLAIVSLVTNISLFIEHINEQMASTTTPIEYEEYEDLPLNQTKRTATPTTPTTPPTTTTDQRNEAEEFFGKKKATTNKKKKPLKNKKEGKRGKQRKKKDPIKVEPNPLSLAPNATFSACLLIKDDNEILNEWLAYHYHNIGRFDCRNRPTRTITVQDTAEVASLTDMEILNDHDIHAHP
jgi:hypothetical protein